MGELDDVIGWLDWMLTKGHLAGPGPETSVLETVGTLIMLAEASNEQRAQCKALTQGHGHSGAGTGEDNAPFTPGEGKTHMVT